MSARFGISSGMSLARLRAGFIALGVVLLGCLVALSLAVEQRLAEAARDREEMVALRVFDELEREVSAFLDIEDGRAPYRDLKGTDPQSWAPFVVGYFRTDGGTTQTVAADGATSENQRRLNWALETAGDRLQPQVPQKRGQAQLQVRAEVPPGQLQQQTRPTPPAQELKKESKESKAPGSPSTDRKGSAIIEQLNRAPERRKSKKPTPSQESANEDQFLDYERLF